MDKITYLAELAEGLARWVPERERQDILRYYAEYFDEAGPGKEAEVIAELGDPWALSCRLAVEGGFVTQEAANAWTPPKRRRTWPFVLAGSLAAMLFVAVSVGIFASLAGRAIGRYVRMTVQGDAVVVDMPDEDWYGFEPINGVAEGEKVAFVNGGFWSTEFGDLDVFSSIDCNISLGNVTVCEGNDFSLSIWRSDGLDSYSLDSYSLDWEVKDNGTLKIRDSSNVEAGTSGFSDWSVDVSITVPYNARLDKISVKTGVGGVSISGVAAEKVTVDANVGDVECYEVREAQKLELKASTGDIYVDIAELWSGLEIDVEADVGTVEVGMGCSGSKCAYKLEASIGQICVDGAYYDRNAEQKGNLPYSLDVESGVGDINVWFYMA